MMNEIRMALGRRRGQRSIRGATGMPPNPAVIFGMISTSNRWDRLQKYEMQVTAAIYVISRNEYGSNILAISTVE